MAYHTPYVLSTDAKQFFNIAPSVLTVDELDYIYTYDECIFMRAKPYEVNISYYNRPTHIHKTVWAKYDGFSDVIEFDTSEDNDTINIRVQRDTRIKKTKRTSLV